MTNIARTMVAGVALAGLFAGASVLAADYSSTNFLVKDPVITPSGGYATSSAFSLWSVIGEPAIGVSESGAFLLKGGFLYFPAPSAATTTPPAGPAPSVDYGPFAVRLTPSIVSTVCDFSGNGACGTADLSILLYYYNQSGPSIERYDLNGNGTVDFPDISILFYYWTPSFV